MKGYACGVFCACGRVGDGFEQPIGLPLLPVSAFVEGSYSTLTFGGRKTCRSPIQKSGDDDDCEKAGPGACRRFGEESEWIGADVWPESGQGHWNGEGNAHEGFAGDEAGGKEKALAGDLGLARNGALHESGDDPAGKDGRR